jgi:acetolactate synthase-1/2/3 large subunit
MKLASIGPVSIAAGQYAPYLEVVGDTNHTMSALRDTAFGPFEWREEELRSYRSQMQAALEPPVERGPGLSPYEVTRCLRHCFPRNTIMTTDVGALKFIVSQAWTAYEGLTCLQSNGLSAMGFGFPAAMAAKLLSPDRPVLCTVGDGGFGMSMAELETCGRERIHFTTVVYNDSQLSLIRVIQQNKDYPIYGVRYNPINFAAVGEALGAWTRRVHSLDELDRTVAEALKVDRPVVIDVPVDPTEYQSHTKPI